MKSFSIGFYVEFTCNGVDYRDAWHRIEDAWQLYASKSKVSDMPESSGGRQVATLNEIQLLMFKELAPPE